MDEIKPQTPAEGSTPAIETPAKADQTKVEEASKPVVDTEKLIAERVKAALDARDAREAELRRSEQLKAKIIQTKLGNAQGLAEFMPNTTDEAILHEWADKFAAKMGRLFRPDFGTPSGGLSVGEILREKPSNERATDSIRNALSRRR